MLLLEATPSGFQVALGGAFCKTPALFAMIHINRGAVSRVFSPKRKSATACAAAGSLRAISGGGKEMADLQPLSLFSEFVPSGVPLPPVDPPPGSLPARGAAVVRKNR